MVKLVLCFTTHDSRPNNLVNVKVHMELFVLRGNSPNFTSAQLLEEEKPTGETGMTKCSHETFTSRDFLYIVWVLSFVHLRYSSAFVECSVSVYYSLWSVLKSVRLCRAGWYCVARWLRSQLLSTENCVYFCKNNSNKFSQRVFSVCNAFALKSNYCVFYGIFWCAIHYSNPLNNNSHCIKNFMLTEHTAQQSDIEFWIEIEQNQKFKSH